MKSLLITLMFVLISSSTLRAEEGHSHENESEHADSEESEKGHADGEKHTDHEGEGEEEAYPQIGPGKGILEASKDKGIRLSPEAEKNFEISRTAVPTQGNFEIPKSAIVTAATEVNLFRYRDGFYKRVDFKFVSKTSNRAVVVSEELKNGDEVVITGLGFLRIAEIAAFGGAPEGHSH